MRGGILPLFLLLVSAPLLGGCEALQTRGAVIGGTVDYATTPSIALGPAGSGALPLHVLYCPSVYDPSWHARRATFVRLGEGCVLELGRPENRRATCDLPTGTGPLRVAVKELSGGLTTYGSGRYSSVGLPLDVVIGGPTVGAERYVTYRFTGATPAGTSDECDALAQTLPPPPGGWRDGEVGHARPNVGR